MKSMVLLSVLLVVLSPAVFGRGGHGGMGGGHSGGHSAGTVGGGHGGGDGGHSGGHAAGAVGGGQTGSVSGASQGNGSHVHGNTSMHQGPISGNGPNSAPGLHRVSSVKNETREDDEHSPGRGRVESPHDRHHTVPVEHKRHEPHEKHEHEGDRRGGMPPSSPLPPGTPPSPPLPPGTAAPVPSMANNFHGLIAPRFIGVGGLMGWPGGYISGCPGYSSDNMVELRCPGKDRPIRCCERDKLDECCKDG